MASKNNRAKNLLVNNDSNKADDRKSRSQIKAERRDKNNALKGDAATTVETTPVVEVAPQPEAVTLENGVPGDATMVEKIMASTANSADAQRTGLPEAQPITTTKKPTAAAVREALASMGKPDYSTLIDGDVLPSGAVVFGPEANATQYWVTMVKPNSVKSWIRFMTKDGPQDIRTLMAANGDVIPPTEVVVALWDRTKTVAKLVAALKGRDFRAEAAQFNWTAGVELCDNANSTAAVATA